ncbi:DUF2892 domain-containing protein [Methanocella sp. CWC-04]|uniref:DUF2892 domain-containing protein n=1 Tax=Methanooceanicella nereidis TaxID=2052831 RepID=A0AAP2RBP6_9EURY|nr:DUF2892 domain-containing protein [Methanocella sp. CWC-04]MCD1294616.1 DUF2892 domain-containing protein [Methanocella sp. CWC-04]
MKRNIGTADRMIRLILGLILVAMGIYVWGLPGMLLILAGLFSVYESIAGWCVLYALLGKNTCPVEKI